MAYRFRHGARSPLGRITLTAFGLRQRVALPDWRVFGQYALVFIIDGAGSYCDANGRRQRLGPGSLVIVFPGLAHLYNPDPGTEWLVSYLCFQGPLFDLWRDHGALDPATPVHDLHSVSAWQRRLEEILGGANRPGFAPPLVELCRLQAFLAEVIAGAGQAPAHADDLDWAERACRRLEANPVEALDWSEVARDLGASVASFRKRFTRLIGEAPARYRMARRIDRACTLMQAGRLTDRQIAETLGFCDEFYFSRRFKQITGMSPRVFRRSLALPADAS